jgi:hypothetical protein
MAHHAEQQPGIHCEQEAGRECAPASELVMSAYTDFQSVHGQIRPLAGFTFRPVASNPHN